MAVDTSWLNLQMTDQHRTGDNGNETLEQTAGRTRVDASSLESFKARLDGVLSDLI